ncbi:cupin domain-containing protein [Nonomuraea longicatena]|uniref:Cupin type-2 domain-containing protein n=1 Tax=Nonomuraea longicatena TaxID=83682 RepID=A0ABN1QDD2_9ACTN
MTLVRNADTRDTETPNAVMTTLASPTVGGAERSLWRVEAEPQAEGPQHAFDVEQIWTWLDGAATVELGDESLVVTRGDTVIMPAGVLRRILAGDRGYTAVVTASPEARAFGADGREYGVPAWIS